MTKLKASESLAEVQAHIGRICSQFGFSTEAATS